jgi:hypothetical protein
MIQRHGVDPYTAASRAREFYSHVSSSNGAGASNSAGPGVTGATRPTQGTAKESAIEIAPGPTDFYLLSKSLFKNISLLYIST